MGSLQNNHILSCQGHNLVHMRHFQEEWQLSVSLSPPTVSIQTPPVPNEAGRFPQENATEWPSSELALHSLEMLQSLVGVCTVSMMRWHLCLSNNVTPLIRATCSTVLHVINSKFYRHLGDVIQNSISGSSRYGLITFLGRIDDCSWQSARSLSWWIWWWEQNPSTCPNLWCEHQDRLQVASVPSLSIYVL